jgi:hypothetical protein
VHFQGADIENKPIVFDLSRRDFTDSVIDTGFGGLSHSEKIEIAGGSILLADPNREQHRTLQDELVPKSRLR